VFIAPHAGVEIQGVRVYTYEKLFSYFNLNRLRKTKRIHRRYRGILKFFGVFFFFFVTCIRFLTIFLFRKASPPYYPCVRGVHVSVRGGGARIRSSHYVHGTRENVVKVPGERLPTVGELLFAFRGGSHVRAL